MTDNFLITPIPHNRLKDNNRKFKNNNSISILRKQPGILFHCSLYYRVSVRGMPSPTSDQVIREKIIKKENENTFLYQCTVNLLYT